MDREDLQAELIDGLPESELLAILRGDRDDECSYCLQLRTDVRHDPILGYVCSRCHEEITDGAPESE